MFFVRILAHTIFHFKIFLCLTNRFRFNILAVVVKESRYVVVAIALPYLQWNLRTQAAQTLICVLERHKCS